jgi:hypothetical protein
MTTTRVYRGQEWEEAFGKAFDAFVAQKACEQITDATLSDIVRAAGMVADYRGTGPVLYRDEDSVNGVVGLANKRKGSDALSVMMATSHSDVDFE